MGPAYCQRSQALRCICKYLAPPSCHRRTIEFWVYKTVSYISRLFSALFWLNLNLGWRALTNIHTDQDIGDLIYILFILSNLLNFFKQFDLVLHALIARVIVRFHHERRHFFRKFRCFWCLSFAAEDWSGSASPTSTFLASSFTIVVLSSLYQSWITILLDVLLETDCVLCVISLICASL